MKQKIAAWAVHGYTAVGGILGLLALYSASLGDIHTSFILLVPTMIIDGTDGLLARAARVKDILPNFNGSEIDNVIDFLTYVWIPVFIMWRAELLPHPLLTLIPVIAALYAYGQVNMKSEDGYFIGFPSYWNIVALYLFWLRPGPIYAVMMVLIPAILSFIPTRYLYPSRGGLLWRTTWLLTSLWGIVVLYLLLQPEPTCWLVITSLLYPAYYLAASFYAELQTRRAARDRALT